MHAISGTMIKDWHLNKYHAAGVKIVKFQVSFCSPFMQVQATKEVLWM